MLLVASVSMSVVSIHTAVKCNRSFEREIVATKARAGSVSVVVCLCECGGGEEEEEEETPPRVQITGEGGVSREERALCSGRGVAKIDNCLETDLVT